MTQFSRLSLCAAAIGALAIAAFVAVPSRAAEDAFVIPAPTADVCAGSATGCERSTGGRSCASTAHPSTSWC